MNNPMDVFCSIALKIQPWTGVSQRLLDLLQVLSQIVDEKADDKPSASWTRIESILEVLAASAREMATRDRLVRVFASTGTQTIDEEINLPEMNIASLHNILRVKKVSKLWRFLFD